ncbi:MAG: hypothetical protein LBB79_05320 [Prevotellaceae bacterium]|jgi:hypothetical protein|nr:hypothetical protein [Prevotellaceae bacterium]
MDEQKIKALLERYFDGATSLPEEQELRRFFAKGNVPATLKPYSALFAFYAHERAVTCPAPTGSGNALRLRRWTLAATAAAAAVALMVTLKTLAPTQDGYTYYVDGKRVYDKEAAMQLADAKLQMLAASMQHAKASMEPFEKLHDASRSLEQLDKIRQMLRQADNMIFVTSTTK